MRQDVVNYLNSSGFEISMAMLANIQGKDYRAIFHSLVLTLDPYYPLKEGTRFEDEFVPALKALQYPFAHQIDQKWLAAVASPHSWPYLLGALHWLVELCRVCQDSSQNFIYTYSSVRRAMNTFAAGTLLSRTQLMFQKNLTTHWITRPLHSNTTRRLIPSGSIYMTTLLNPIKQWRNATVITRFLSLYMTFS